MIDSLSLSTDGEDDDRSTLRHDKGKARASPPPSLLSCLDGPLYVPTSNQDAKRLLKGSAEAMRLVVVSLQLSSSTHPTHSTQQQELGIMDKDWRVAAYDPAPDAACAHSVGAFLETQGDQLNTAGILVQTYSGTMTRVASQADLRFAVTL